MELGLTDKTVLVTDAGSGIGRATALAFVEEKACVAVGYHTDREAAEETAALAVKRGGHAISFRLDPARPEELEAAVEDARWELGPISVLVNNAVRRPGRAIPGELFETAPAERFTASVNANLIGPYLLARAVVADMREERWGRIVNVSTGPVEDGFSDSTPYIAAESGLHGLTRAMSRELACAGILSNLVMPGFTPGDEHVPPELIEKPGRAAATRAINRSDDVARLIVFLCSAANTNTTGEVIRTDGHFLSPT
ncbi:SDR family NAD(P)-dependent oxidoreductase [Actinomadura rugatobispora]|uniref:SDR family NAD(P)-dependent oxidoreductase n=1 Tax=Actinomadura rugatobispora TaxID=1994 RepID=A0ABW1A2A2_9ACTN|nr:3-oxoacyl-[acyl-carrier-protein] reductase [Actinomadura rugatobispora]